MTHPSTPAPEIRILSERISAVQADLLTSICRRLGAHSELGSLELAPPTPPRVVVAALPAQTRRIPLQWIDWMNTHAETASLLLLCNEPLVRPSVTDSDGRVTLVAWDSGFDVIASRLRVLLSDTPHINSDTEGEHLTQRWWSATGGHLSSLSLHCESDGSARVAINPSESSANLVEHARQRALSLNADADTWQIDWPALPSSLWLLSVQRLPQVTDLAASHGGHGLTRVRAAAGDVALALSPTPRDALHPAVLGELTSALPGGGPLVFDAILRATRQHEPRVVVLEVR